jgi:phosphodiesterase/alkaline phosphatase D-like protein
MYLDPTYLDNALTPQKTTWDDHEIANNGYRDGFSGMNNTEASFSKFGRISVDARKMNAVRAYFEWMPIRQVDLDDNLRIWRNFKMGKLFDLGECIGPATWCMLTSSSYARHPQL